jgi:hypothetical protein
MYKKGQTLQHSNHGEVTFVEPLDKDTSVVRLANGVLREVSNVMLKEPTPAKAKSE